MFFFSYYLVHFSVAARHISEIADIYFLPEWTLAMWQEEECVSNISEMHAAQSLR